MDSTITDLIGHYVYKKSAVETVYAQPVDTMGLDVHSAVLDPIPHGHCDVSGTPEPEGLL